MTTNTCDAYGRIASIAGPEGTIHYEYDALTGQIARTHAPSLGFPRGQAHSDGIRVCASTHPTVRLLVDPEEMNQWPS